MLVRNIRIGGRRTSIRLEERLWEVLDEVCREEGMSLNGLCSSLAAEHAGGNFTSALRCWMVDYFRARVRDEACRLQLSRPEGQNESPGNSC